MGTLARSALARRFAPLTLALGLLVGPSLTACGDKHPPTPVVTATTMEIVAQNTTDRLLALPFKKDADGDALRAFVTATAAAKGRADLKTAWAAQASLATKAATFLDDVFRLAESEARWPRPPAPEAEPAAIEKASVEGVRTGVGNYLK